MGYSVPGYICSGASLFVRLHLSLFVRELFSVKYSPVWRAGESCISGILSLRGLHPGGTRRMVFGHETGVVRGRYLFRRRETRVAFKCTVCQLVVKKTALQTQSFPRG